MILRSGAFFTACVGKDILAYKHTDEENKIINKAKKVEITINNQQNIKMKYIFKWNLE